jgi:hypothetical protein
VKKEKLQHGEPLAKKNPIKELPGVYHSYVLLMGLAQRIWVERLEGITRQSMYPYDKSGY